MSKPFSEEHKRKISEAKKGIPRSEETKRKLSIAHTGKHLSEEHKRKIGEAGRGRPGRHWSEEEKQRMSEIKKGCHLSEETKKKIGNAGRGKVMSEEAKRKISISQSEKNSMRGRTGENHPFYGKHHTEEAKKKIGLVHVGKKPANAGKPGKRGPESSNWRGGITPIRKSIRESIQYRDWRQQCFLRDNFTCQNCGTRGTTLNVHHEKPFIKLLKEAVDASPLLSIFDAAMAYAPFWDIGNGETLCTYCHNVSKHKYKQEPSVSRMLNGDGRVKRYQSEETKMKIRLARLGTHPSEESRKKMSESAIRYQQAKKAISRFDNHMPLLQAVNQ